MIMSFIHINTMLSAKSVVLDMLTKQYLGLLHQYEFPCFINHMSIYIYI